MTLDTKGIAKEDNIYRKYIGSIYIGNLTMEYLCGSIQSSQGFQPRKILASCFLASILLFYSKFSVNFVACCMDTKLSRCTLLLDNWFIHVWFIEKKSLRGILHFMKRCTYHVSLCGTHYMFNVIYFIEIHMQSQFPYLNNERKDWRGAEFMVWHHKDG